MAIKVSGTTVIDDTRKVITGINSGTGLNGSYSNFHPDGIDTITTAIDFHKPVMKLAMTGNVTFTTTNTQLGATATLLLDTSTSGHTPTFGSEVMFGVTPTWSNNRHWQITFTCTNNLGADVRATAIGFDEPSAASSTFNDWTFNSSWNTTQSGYGTFSSPWAAVWVSFQHQTTNNRIAVVHGAGNFNTGSNQYTSYATYTGLSNITSVTAQYTVQSQSVSGSNTNPSGGYSYGPLPTNDGYSSGSYYTVPTSGSLFFGWQAVSQNGDPQSTQSQASFSGPIVDFRIKIVDSVEGTLYATSDLGGIGMITATSNWGNTQAI
jgi:hypothetical protein